MSSINPFTTILAGCTPCSCFNILSVRARKASQEARGKSDGKDSRAPLRTGYSPAGSRTSNFTLSLSGGTCTAAGSTFPFPPLCSIKLGHLAELPTPKGTLHRAGPYTSPLFSFHVCPCSPPDDTLEAYDQYVSFPIAHPSRSIAFSLSSSTNSPLLRSGYTLYGLCLSIQATSVVHSRSLL